MPQMLIYARVSTDEQAEKGRSIEDQIAICRRTAEARGHTVGGVYTDPGKSGSLPWDKRPGLRDLMTHCQRPEVEVVIVLDTDRIARDAHQHLTIKTLFQKFSVRLLSVNQPGLSENTPESSLIDTIIAAVNGYLPKVTGRKAALAMEQKVKEGWWPGWARLGYRNVNVSAGERPQNVIQVDPVAGPLVRQAFELYASGAYSLRRLVEEMNRRGLRGKTGRPMTVGSLQKRLKDPFYYGEFRFKGVCHPAKHEPLISKELFDKVQAMLDQQNRNADRSRKHDFLLRGFVFCGHCGGRLTAEIHPSKGKAYYHCALTGERHSNRGQNVDVEDLEGQVADLFKKIQFPETFIKKVVEHAGEILRQTRAGVDEERRILLVRKGKLEEQRDTLEQKLLEGVVSDETFQRNHQRITREKREIKEKIEELADDREINIAIFEELLRLARTIHQGYMEAPLLLKRRYLGIFWERIEVTDRKITKAVPTLAFQALFPDSNIAEYPVITNERWLPLDQTVITESFSLFFKDLLNDIRYWRKVANALAEMKGVVKGPYQPATNLS